MSRNRAGILAPLIITDVGTLWETVRVTPGYAVLHWGLVVCLPLFAIRLYFACRCYLRFGRSGAAALAVLIIVALIGSVAVSNL